jgi:hypothetical protein
LTGTPKTINAVSSQISGISFPFKRNFEKTGCMKNSKTAAIMLKNCNTKKALKICDFVFLFIEVSGNSAFCKPFSQKKLTAPAIKTKVSYWPISAGVIAVFVKTTPVKISVEYLTNW